MEIDGAVTNGETVQLDIGLIIEDENGKQKPAVGTYYWDATDPLVVALHFEVFLSAVVIERDSFTIPEGTYIPADADPIPACSECDDEIEFDTYACLEPSGRDDDVVTIYCLACGRDREGAECEEALWVFGIAELEGALVDSPPAPPGAAQARVWRQTAELFQIALHAPLSVHILTLAVDELELMLGAVRDYLQMHGGEEIIVDDYLAGGLAALERHANKPKRGKKK